MIVDARAEALFASSLSTGSRPDRMQATDAIRTAVRRCRGVLGCAVEMAGAYADSPESAVRRMRWARGVVQTLFGPAQYGRSEIAGRWAGPTRTPAPPNPNGRSTVLTMCRGRVRDR
jgi:hypothetical protein